MMQQQILIENNKKRLDMPLGYLLCFAMFVFWQMAFVYYFLEPSSAIDGKIPLPINIDNATSLTAICYVLSILWMIFLPRLVVWAQRVTTGVALISSLGFFLPLPEDALRLLIYMQVFCCCFMIGFESFLMVNYFSEKGTVKHLTVAYSIGLFMIALIQNELFPIPFSVFRYGMVAALILLLLFFLRMPAGNAVQPRYVKKDDGFTSPRKLLYGVYGLIFICALMGVSAPAIAGKAEHGVSVMYLVDAVASLGIYLLYKKRGIHPFRLVPVLVGLGGLGYLLMYVTVYVPALSYVACGLLGISMLLCQMVPLYGAVLMKSYPSKYITPVFMGLSITAVLVHSAIAELFLDTPTMLNLVYTIIMVVLIFVYMQIEPFLLFALPRRNADHHDGICKNIPVAEVPVEEVPEAPDPLALLTPREREVAELICMGYTNGDIARMLFITEHTVKDHTKKIYPKMGVRSRFELAALVSRQRSAKD